MQDDALSKAVDAELPGLERQQEAIRNALHTKTQAALSKRRKSISSVSQVLNKLVSKLGLDKRLREHTLMNLWPAIIGESFAQRSRAIFIDYEGNLVVAVKDASVGQELSLYKPEIMKKLRSAASSVGVKINGLRFDMKHFHAKPPPTLEGLNSGRRAAPPEPTDEELYELELSQEEWHQIEQLKIRLSEASVPAAGSAPEAGKPLSQRMLTMFEKEMRLRKWRQCKGYPLCPACREPAAAFHGRDGLCGDCYFESQSQK